MAVADIQKLLSVPEIADQVGKSRATVYAWAARDQIPGVVHIGGSVFVQASVFADFIAAGGGSPPRRPRRLKP